LGPKFQSVIAQGLRKVVANLILRDVSSLGEERVAGATRGCSADVEPGNIGIPEKYGGRKRRQRRGAVRVIENCAVPRPGQNELVHCGRAESVRFIQLALPLRLVAGDVKKGTDRVGIGGWHPVIVKQAQKYAIVGGGVEIDAAGKLLFGGQVVVGRLKERRASDPGSEPRETIASERVRRQRTGTRHGFGCSVGVIVETEEILVELDGRRSGRETIVVFQISDRCVLERLTRKCDGGAYRNYDAQSFGVEEKKQLVLLDRTSERTGPLVGIAEVLRIARMIQKPIVRVQRAAVPIINRIAVKFVAAGFCHVVDARPGQAAVFSRIPAADNRALLDFVRAE